MKYICTRMRLSNYLQSKGYKVIDTMPNVYRAGFVVWVFEKTDSLISDVEKYFNENRNGMRFNDSKTDNKR